MAGYLPDGCTQTEIDQYGCEDDAGCVWCGEFPCLCVPEEPEEDAPEFRKEDWDSLCRVPGRSSR